ncbi:MAG: hypothetical protein PHW60_11910 [Kiritimatiellae bacterium]|nr:hypothetical protein [Kiritimatiellia bacterium]
MKHKGRWLGIICIAVTIAIGLPAAQSATTWNTAGSGDKTNWFDAGNWNPAGVPGDGADVVITNGSILLTNETAALSSLTITNARLTFSNWTTRVSATNVTRIIITNSLAGAGLAGSYSVAGGTGSVAGADGSFVILSVPPPKGLIFSIH